HDKHTSTLRLWVNDRRPPYAYKAICKTGWHYNVSLLMQDVLLYPCQKSYLNKVLSAVSPRLRQTVLYHQLQSSDPSPYKQKVRINPKLPHKYPSKMDQAPPDESVFHPLY